MASFEDYLRYEFTEDNPQIADDALPDAFDAFLESCTVDDWLRLGTQYARRYATPTT